MPDKINIRYKYCPQLKTYDKFSFKWAANLMFMNEPNYISQVCNTDSFGLRFNSVNTGDFKNQSIFDQETKKEKSIMVGSSSTFGVGASSDEKTIPSILSNNSEYIFYNLGARAFNGMQEIILTELMINKLDSIKKIVLYSGMNDIYMFYNKNFLHEYPGPFYFNKEFLDITENSSLSFSRKILKFLFPNLNIDYKNISVKDTLNTVLLNKKDGRNEKLKSSYPNLTLEEVVSRNIKLWKIFSKSTNTDISFFLPPFLPWCKSKTNYTVEEKDIDNFLTSNQGKNGTFNYYSYLDNIKNDYSKIIRLFEENCKKNNIPFYDCNILFQQKENNDKWLFVDKVHLTDYGNDLVSHYILSKL